MVTTFETLKMGPHCRKASRLWKALRFQAAAYIFPGVQTRKNLDRARQCYEKAATGQERQGSPWHAGKMMEKAAEVCKEGPGSQVETAELYRQAAKYYAEAGRAQTSGESLCRGAKVVEEKDPAVSSPSQQ